jgi:hypothetical protein
MPCIAPSYRSCNPREGFHPTRSRACKPEKPDHISVPGPARLPKPSRLSKSPQPECASGPPSLTGGTPSAQGSRQPTLIQVNSRLLASHHAGDGDVDEDCRAQRNDHRAHRVILDFHAENRPLPIHRAGRRSWGSMRSVNPAMLSGVPSRRRWCAHVIRVGIASPAAGSRCPALGHRRVAAILVTGPSQPDNLHAKRKLRIVFLGLGRPSCQNRPDYQKRQPNTTQRNLRDISGTASTHRSRQTKLITVNSRSLANFCGRGRSSRDKANPVRQSRPASRPYSR